MQAAEGETVHCRLAVNASAGIRFAAAGIPYSRSAQSPSHDWGFPLCFALAPRLCNTKNV